MQHELHSGQTIIQNTRNLIEPCQSLSKVVSGGKMKTHQILRSTMETFLAVCDVSSTADLVSALPFATLVTCALVMASGCRPSVIRWDKNCSAQAAVRTQTRNIVLQWGSSGHLLGSPLEHSGLFFRGDSTGPWWRRAWCESDFNAVVSSNNPNPSH